MKANGITDVIAVTGGRGNVAVFRKCRCSLSDVDDGKKRAGELQSVIGELTFPSVLTCEISN